MAHEKVIEKKEKPYQIMILRDCLDEKTLMYEFPSLISKETVEFFKPFARIVYADRLFWVDRPYFFRITSALESNKLYVTFRINKPAAKARELLEKQLDRFFFQDFCAGCEQLCRQGALSIQGGKFRINEGLCDNCLECVEKECIRR